MGRYANQENVLARVRAHQGPLPEVLIRRSQKKK